MAPRDEWLEPSPMDAERLKAVIAVLEEIVRDRGLLGSLTVEERTRLLRAAGDLYEPDLVQRRRSSKAVRRNEKAAKAERDRAVLADTGIRVLREKPVFTTPNVFPPEAFEQTEVNGDPEFREVVEPQHCYVCKQLYVGIHPFYDQLCPGCGDFNYAKRSESADLGGRVALLTGGRVKIGYQAGIKLLRAGAQLIVTTRFPRDAAARYAAELDFEEWGDRLEIVGLDLRHTPSVEAFCQHVGSTRGRLDFIVNNACQTVRRPPEFYRHMMERETASAERLPAHERRLLGEFEGLRRSDILSAGDAVPALPVAGGEVRLGRARAALPRGPPRPGPAAGRPARAQFVAAAARRGLVGRAARDAARERGRAVRLERAPQAADAARPGRDKHIVNVSAVEGQFYRRFKTTRHPHTNMAKAALNMMTRTSAADYHADGIHMNSVDTGWVTDEDPAQLAERKTAEHGFQPTARHRRRCRPHRRSDHRRLQHRRARLGAVPEGLPPDRLVAERSGRNTRARQRQRTARSSRGQRKLTFGQGVCAFRPPAIRRSTPCP